MKLPFNPTKSLSDANGIFGKNFSDFNFNFIYSFIGDRLPLPITPFRPDVTDPAKNTSQGNISVNESLVNSTTIQEQSSLCGFPSFCSGEAQRRCLNTTLINCDQCNLGIAVIFGVFVGALGLSIIVLNSLTLCYCFFKEKQTYYDHMKASLAVADILTGFQPLIVSLYNLSWTLQSTVREIDKIQLSLRGSPQATIGGMFYLLGFSSSLYHLVLLGQQRIYAINWPIRYKMQAVKSVYKGIGVVWILSLLSATTPAWFPEVFTFTYSHTIFLFNLTLMKIGNTNYTPLAVMVAIIFILPFLLMTSLTLTSAVLVRVKLATSEKLSQRSPGKSEETFRQKEASVLKTVALMQLGFTVTLVPIVVLLLLDYTNVLDCSNISKPYVICFYLSMSNSLVNVLVYSIRDKCFRKWISKLFSKSLLAVSYSKETDRTKSPGRSIATEATESRMNIEQIVESSNDLS